MSRRPARSRVCGVTIATGLLGACVVEEPEPPPREAAALVVPAGWEPVPAGQDAYDERRPASVSCEPGQGYLVEQWWDGPVLEIDTGLCNFVTLRQPARVDLRADEVIDLGIWHFPLVADAPAEAMVGLAVDGEPVWEQRVPIPSDAQLIEAIIEPTRTIPEGSELQFHLDNHGDNRWILVRLDRQPSER